MGEALRRAGNAAQGPGRIVPGARAPAPACGAPRARRAEAARLEAASPLGTAGISAGAAADTNRRHEQPLLQQAAGRQPAAGLRACGFPWGRAPPGSIPGTLGQLSVPHVGGRAARRRPLLGRPASPS